MGITPGVAGVDRGQVDRRPDVGGERVGGGDQLALEAVNRPRTVVTSSWRMANETRERAGSILQVPAT